MLVVSAERGNVPRCVKGELPREEKERAKMVAEKEAREHFSLCPICRRLVCDSCFMICDEMDMCKECAYRMEEYGESVVP